MSQEAEHKHQPSGAHDCPFWRETSHLSSLWSEISPESCIEAAHHLYYYRFVKSSSLLSFLYLPGIKMFECTVCHKKLSTNISLQEHMTVHSGEKPLICPVCGRKFRQKAVLKRHIITHSEDKPYACTVCDKKFSMKVYVKSHMKTHTGMYP